MTERVGLGRSLQASAIGIIKANKAVLVFARKADLAEELEISRSTLQKFFSGRLIGRENFHQICQRLGLDWRAIADISNLEAELARETLTGHETSNASSEPADTDDIEALVQLVRQQGQTSIQAQCSTIRVLDMSQPMALKDIYTHLNILERISGRRRVTLDELIKTLPEDLSDRLPLTFLSGKRVDGLEAVAQFDKLIVLGRPGVGKTTFLKYLALQCSLGEFQAKRVPIFISLKDFAEIPERSSLFDHIHQQIRGYRISAPRATQQLLQQGRMLVLLDGLDEVKEQDIKRVVQEVQRFSMQFPLNQFVMTCRLATQDYTFEKFTEVEVADFDNEQISAFVRYWFANKDPAMGDRVIEKLQLPINRPIRELATNPLLLTLLCLIFQDCGESPLNRCELYKEGLEILLKKWDSKRNIEREQIYQTLSLRHKEALLSRIAWLTFSRSDYFFQQSELEQQISNYLSHLSEAETHSNSPQFDSQAVLKSIEAQHGLLVERARGIYSFSHLSFQEYFAARELVSSATPQSLEASLKKLVKHLVDPRWREVFLLTSGMLPQPEVLLRLMKQRLQHLIDQDAQVQQCLLWLQQKSTCVETNQPPLVVRAFYFDLEVARILNLDRLLDLSRTLESNLTRQLDPDLTLDLALDRILTLTGQITTIPEPMGALSRVLSRAIARVHNVDSAKTTNLAETLQRIKAQLPKQAHEPQAFNIWWNEHGEAWTEKLRMAMISCRDIGHNWQFNQQQQQKLKQYYDASCLFADCLNNVPYLTSAVRTEIEQDLLQPISRLKPREGYGVA